MVNAKGIDSEDRIPIPGSQCKPGFSRKTALWQSLSAPVPATILQTSKSQILLLPTSNLEQRLFHSRLINSDLTWTSVKLFFVE